MGEEASAVVAVAARPEEAAMLAGRLAELGGGSPTLISMGPVRSVVHVPFTDEGAAGVLVGQLRAEGWAAVLRPGGGGHLAAWSTHTRPVEVSERLWISFPWSEFDRAAAPVLAEIDPGRAFGTGAHPTTALLAAELSRRLHGGERVLDVGCGSGVLAIAAALLGAAAVTAIDVDPGAVLATRANAARNAVLGRIEASTARLAELHGPFDAVVANVDAATLRSLALDLGPLVAPAGWLGLSGVSIAQCSTLAAAYRGFDWTLRRAEDWAALVGERPSGLSRSDG